jgi:type III restriction enzyme
MGIPFDFAANPVVAPPKPPKPTVRVQAIKERAKLEIVFPRVEGYRVELPDERIVAHFSDDSRLILTPELVGPCKVLMEGIVGEGVELNMQTFDAIRPSTITYHLAKHLMQKSFRDHGEDLPVHLFGDIKRVVRQWLDGGWLVCRGGTKPGQVTYLQIADEAAERIYLACQRHEEGRKRIKAILDPYNPKGSTKHVGFNTSKDVYRTSPERCHVNYVVTDSDWEAELARVLESHKQVRSYVKNQGLQFEVPYRAGSTPRKYLPDFIVAVDDGSEDFLNLVLETKGYRKRLASICDLLDLTQPLPGDVYYQLLHRTAAAIIEARRFKTDAACMIVHSFSPTGKWFDAFERFVALFGLKAEKGRLMAVRPNGSPPLYVGWATGDPQFLVAPA